MYGLPQAGVLANIQLQGKLESYGYYQCRSMPGLWWNRWRPIVFMLIVDDFGVKYVGEKHVKTLFSILAEQYYYFCIMHPLIYLASP